MGRIFDATLVQVTLRMAVPLILASIGGILCAQVNVFNIALEAMMLVGALFGVVGGYLWGTWYAGLLTALAAGLICAGVFALFTIRLKGHPIIVGVALNLLAGGLTVVLMRVFFKGRGFFLLEIPLLPTFKLLGLPPQNILYWAAFIGIILCHLFLYYTSWGLRMRAVGLKPVAAMTTGVSPEIYQYAAVLASGLFCGAAGAWLSLGSLGMFTENMSSGRGFIALAAVLFGRATPVWVLVSTIIFGFAEALAIRLQGRGIPSDLVLMVPYLATVISLWLATKRQNRQTGLAAK
ncbi:MAG TPA: ABC transporter permease [Firmicutes bacterium]|nr:ABC transporter permease [Bacillota bacterium]